MGGEVEMSVNDTRMRSAIDLEGYTSGNRQLRLGQVDWLMRTALDTPCHDECSQLRAPRTVDRQRTAGRQCEAAYSD